MDFLVIDDDRIFREAICFLIEEEGHYAEGPARPEAALEHVREGKFDAVLLDLHLGRIDGLALLADILKLRPALPVVMVSAQGTIKTAVQAIQKGAADFLEKPFTREQFLAVVARLRRIEELGRKIEKLEEQVRESRDVQPDPLMDFETPAMKGIMEVLKRAAKSDASVLILGESGTGKSVAARALHSQSHLANEPFVTVSCPSLSRELLESQLFGHVRGAFTGALKDTWGKVKAADGGTLFLDEIGDLPLEIQPKLLRLLQEREYERVGETQTHRAAVRIVAATNRDLRKRVAEGAFREDLFYRLNVISVQIPALRDRPRDILRFAQHYLGHCTRRCGRTTRGFTAPAEELLRHYPWPGNLRELYNTVERSVILSAGDWIDAPDLPHEIRQTLHTQADGAFELKIGAKVPLERIEELHIRRVVEDCNSLSEAAQVLGVNVATLYRRRKAMAQRDGAEVAPDAIPLTTSEDEPDPPRAVRQA